MNVIVLMKLAFISSVCNGTTLCDLPNSIFSVLMSQRAQYNNYKALTTDTSSAKNEK